MSEACDSSGLMDQRLGKFSVVGEDGGVDDDVTLEVETVEPYS